ncbi:MAG TPA: formimidoylglutamase [Chitinophagaceae bacterium]|nr:formimidoylglutamase [Chitinophagaceae bacterium]
MSLQHFRFYTKEDILSLTHLRRFETKIGERLQAATGSDLQSRLKSASAKYVIIGIPENIGVRANGGVGGTATAWLSFLQAFLNMQDNDFFQGNEVLLLGHFDFSDMERLIDEKAGNDAEKRDAYRHAVVTIDEEVEKLVKAIVLAGKFPIVIGGGHNNAYPLIKGTAKGLQQAQQMPLLQINCINLDAHTDYRPEEGRHSGNAFRYAESDGFLQKYCVVGIHEGYLPQNVWIDVVNNPFTDCITYEDIFIHEKRTFRQAVVHAIAFTEDNFTGIELDLDSIENVLSSAETPCGITPIQARQYVSLCAASSKQAYLHLCEGAVELQNGKKNEATGKLLSYLVTDFIKMHLL